MNDGHVQESIGCCNCPVLGKGGHAGAGSRDALNGGRTRGIHLQLDALAVHGVGMHMLHT